jgi:arylsulfatase
LGGYRAQPERIPTNYPEPAAGEPDVKEKLLSKHKMGGRKYKVHLDGYNFLPYLTGQEEESPRKEFFYFSDDGDLTGLRYDDWKVVFAQPRRRPSTSA